ncbi:aldo/keto reductase [Phenylobacterium immobile]|uniref:aldo/keto reductase n=1 Tax=Phenylobacterium immobile TaxID=21 RepID=UPI000A5F1258|nr:aldo/keto reductase [Phenylobacterium immobile]
MAQQPTLRLNDGSDIPQLGFGFWQAPADIAAEACANALKAGYRHLDTAMIYGNEAGVGEGVKASGVAREEIYVTTKLWNPDQGFESALAAMDKSLDLLGMDYVDLYLIHWPAPHLDKYVDSWKALIRLKEEGKAKAIGVSNFTAEHLDRIIGETGVAPALNQIELHPLFQQRDMRAIDEARTVATQSWSPLGQGGALLSDPTILALAKKHGKTAAQVIIRWHLDSGLIVIPKSVTPSRIVENFDVFDFSLDADDMAAVAALDSADGRIGPDPATAAF